MTKKEFYDRTGVVLNGSEFRKMQEVYSNSKFDKDEFCRRYKMVVSVVMHEEVWLCSRDKQVKLVKEQLLRFDNEEKMHEYCASMCESMQRNNMAFNGKNINRYFELLTRVLEPEEKIFMFLK